MSIVKLEAALGAVVVVLLLLAPGNAALGQDKKIKIGVVYDLTGPLAGGGRTCSISAPRS